MRYPVAQALGPILAVPPAPPAVGALLYPPAQICARGIVPTSPLDPFDVDLVTYLSPLLGVPIHPGHIPQGKDPIAGAVSFFALSEEPYYTLARNAGLTARVYQFSSWSSSHLTACSIETSLRAALHGFLGMMGRSLVTSCRLQQCLDLPFETEVDGDDDGTYQRAVEYRIAFREPLRTFAGA